MGKLQKNEQGFSAVEIVLVVVIVALIGTVGWLVYKNHHKTTTAAITTTSSNKPAPTIKTTTPAKTTPATPQQQYLVISELGIKLPLTSGISDLIYSYVPNTSLPTASPSGSALYFSTTSLDNYSSDCQPNDSGNGGYGAFGYVTVTKSPEPASLVGTDDESVGVLYAQANGDYIYWKGEQSSCLATEANGGQPSQAALNLFNTQLPLVQTALKGAVAN